MPEHLRGKVELRKELRQLRRNLGPAVQQAAAAAVATYARQLPGWSTTRRIALYLASDGEIDPTNLSALCREAGMQLFLPVVDVGQALGFAEWTATGKLVENRFGIPEPTAAALRCKAAELDIVIMPLVAWDSEGGRLGMGSGFYDRTLAGISGPLRVGLSHSLQQVERVPCNDWDVPLDFVITDCGIHRCQGSNCGRAVSPE